MRRKRANDSLNQTHQNDQDEQYNQYNNPTPNQQNTQNTHSAQEYPQAYQTDQSRPRIDQSSFNLTASEAQTSYAGSSVGEMTHNSTHVDDDARSRISVYTYGSAEASRFVKTVEGRGFNVLNETYFLPSDEDEWTRLNKQHIAVVLGLGALYPARDVVRAVLAPEDGVTKKILDLGSGTGVWAIEMAKEFPHCDVVGVDISPTPVDPGGLPPNCHFEIDDITLGLPHFKDQFDIVHARFIGSGLRDFKQSQADIHQCLKPGGIIIWMDVDYDIYTTDVHTYFPIATDDNPGGTWLGRVIYEMRRAALKTGRSDIAGMAEALDEGLFEDSLIDPETCKVASLYVPVGPWATNEDFTLAQQLNYAGSLIRQDLKEVHRAGHPLLIRSGFPAKILNEWSAFADEEMSTLKKPMLGRFRLAWGRRRAEPGESAPSLPSAPPSPTDAENHSRAKPLPYYYESNTREEALAQSALRNRNKDIPPPPLPF